MILQASIRRSKRLFDLRWKHDVNPPKIQKQSQMHLSIRFGKEMMHRKPTNFRKG
jgi:hypothetical protein